MGANCVLFYAEGEVRPILRSAPPPDRVATEALVRRLYPAHRIAALPDGDLEAHAGPPAHELYAGCFPGLTVICGADVALDRPSELEGRFLAEAAGRTVRLHAMHSASSWFAYAIWAPDGVLRRSLSLSWDTGIEENIGAPLPFEEPYWAGQRPLDPDGGLPRGSFPFHPLELGEDALCALFGYEGVADDPDPRKVVLAGFAVRPAEAG